MVVKEKRGRRRYVAFSVPPEVNKTILITRLRTFSDAPPYVIQCDDGLAVLRCAPDDICGLVEIMKKACSTSESLMTSGTLKALRTKVPGLDVKRSKQF